nr:hypothetical protein [Tanacetum cinerariifolium]
MNVGLRKWTRMVIGLDLRVKSYTKSSNDVISCTIKGKPLVLSWGRTPRLDSGVRVRAHIMSENVRVCVCKVWSKNCTLWGVRVPIFIGRVNTEFGLVLARYAFSAFIRLAGPRAHCNNTVQTQRPDITRLRFRCLSILLSCSAAAYLSVAFPFIGSITDIRFVLAQRALTIFCETYHIPDEVHPQLPSPNQTIHEMPSGKILSHPYIQLSVIGAAKVSHFEVLCRVHGFEPTVRLFRCFYIDFKNKGWMSFSKRPGSDVVCYTKPLDSLKNWNDRFFWVDGFACPASFPWNNSKGVSKDPFPKSFEFNAKHFATLVALLAPFHKYLKPFLCLVGISRYYTLDEDAYPEFLGDNDEEMDLLAFIRTADPTKVRVAERQRVENEPRLLESTVGRVVSLLPITPARASSELEASVDKLFDERASGDGQGADIQPVVVTTDTIVEDVAPLQPRRQRKRKTDVADAGGPSHPPKKLREDYGALGGASTAGKSMSAVQSLFTGAVLNAEARGEPIPTLPFVTSSVSATPEREDKSPADSVTGLNLRTVGAPSSAPTIATVTIVTATIDADATTARAPVAPSLFGVGSSSTGRTDFVPGGFSDVSCSEFLMGGIRTVVAPDSDLQKVYVPRWNATNGFGLDDTVSVVSLNSEVRMRAEYNIREKKKLRAAVDEQAELLKVKDGEIESLKAQLLLKEAEAAEAIRLRAEVFKFEVAEQSLRGEVEVREQVVADLDTQVTAIKLRNDNLMGQVHELEISYAGLQEKVAAYEDFIGQLEKFQDEKVEEVNKKFNKLCADFVDMALHLEEKFYLILLTTISGRRWLLTYGMQLAVVKCLNSTEYLSALRTAISKAVEKGMQEGLSVGITHGAEGRKLADVAAYNPSAEADYLSALQNLHKVNFSLIAELKSNKDASVDTIMNLLHLDDVLAERLGLTGSQTLNQLMKMRENIDKHVSALRGVFVPLSVAALKGIEGTSGSTHDAPTTLSTTFVFASTIPPISTDDYEVAHADGQGVPVVDDETATVDNMNLFSDVSNAELNNLE